MSIVGLWRLLWRQRTVVVVMSVLTLVGLVGVIVIKPPAYISKGSVVLLNPPARPDDPVGESGSGPTTTVASDNPWARYNDLGVVVDIVVRIMKSDATVQELQASGVTKFDIGGSVDFQRGPIIEITTETDSAGGARASAEIVLKKLQDVLSERQAAFATDPTYFVGSDVLEIPSDGARVLSSTIRSLIAVAALGMIMTIGSALALDSWHSWRRKTHEKRAADVTPEA